MRTYKGFKVEVPWKDRYLTGGNRGRPAKGTAFTVAPGDLELESRGRGTRKSWMNER